MCVEIIEFVDMFVVNKNLWCCFYFVLCFKGIDVFMVFEVLVIDDKVVVF